MDRAEWSALYFQLWGKSSQSMLKFCIRDAEFFSNKCELVNKETLPSTLYEGLPKVEKDSTPSLWKSFTLCSWPWATENLQELMACTLSFVKLFGALLERICLQCSKTVFREASCRKDVEGAVITLIPKKVALQNVGNWNPVSLLCKDYKVLSKAVATYSSRFSGTDNFSLPDGLVWKRDGIKYLGVFLVSRYLGSDDF